MSRAIAITLAEHAEAIRHLGRRLVMDVIEIGRRLTEAKELCGHGNWLPWLEREFGWVERTAQRFMAVHELAAKYDSVSDLSSMILPVSSLYALAAPSTPEEVRDEVIERAANGEAPTRAQIKQLIADAREADGGETEILKAARVIRARLTEERMTARMERHAKLATEVLLPQGLWSILYVDIPLRWNVHSDSGSWRTPQEHYPTMTLDEIKALKIPAAEHAAMLLWAWAPWRGEIIRDVLEEAWRFTPVSEIIWEKIGAPGTGYWNRNKHEVLLIGTRGDFPCPAPSNRPPSVIKAPRGRHSEKPAIFRDIIDKMFPGLPKLEMFARRVAPRPLWTFHGNEISLGDDDDAAAFDTGQAFTGR